MARQSTRVCYTLNNYTNEEYQALVDYSEVPNCIYHVIGKEVGEQGTPHLQGFVIFHRKVSFTWLRREFNARAHYEWARGPSAAAAEYCKKDGDFVEHGYPPRQGGRSDIEIAQGWIRDFVDRERRVPTERELADACPITYLRNRRGCMEYARAICPAPNMRQGELRDWQDELHQELDEGATDREILFYVDIDGNQGKTWFQQWYLSTYPEKTQVLGVGKRDDMAFAVDASKSVFFISVPRGHMQYFQYGIAEQLKDRMVFSPKYDSQMKILSTTPHVIVFSNEEPDYSMLSGDRMIIRRL